MTFHDGKVNGVTGRDPPMAEDNFFRAFDDGPIDSQHLIDDAKERVKCGLDGVAAVDRNVAVQDLLKRFGIRNQALPLADQLLEPSLRVAFARMRRAHEIHRDVGVDQDHGCAPVTYPLSISANMPSISLTG